MEQKFLKIESNICIAADVYEMKLSGDVSAITAPGQFVNIKLDGLYLRRPISVCDWVKGSLTLIYKVVGEGTKLMSSMEPGKVLDVLVGLGNGFDTSKSGSAPLLIGGGVGTPPMYGLCKRLLAEGKKPSVILGFNSERDVFYKAAFEALGVPVTITTVDGSCGIKGFVTDAMDIEYSYTYACGPMPMLRAIYNKSTVSGQYSFEERMGCGFGACMGCSCETNYGNLRICKDGPVLEKEVIKW